MLPLGVDGSLWILWNSLLAKGLITLPVLGSTQQPGPSEDRRGGLTTEQKERLANKRAEALQRKLDKEREQEIALLEEPEDEEEPFGLGTDMVLDE